MMRRLLFSLAIVAAISGRRSTPGEEPAEQPNAGKPNVETPTLGGMQFWGDELLYRDWRIQRHATTGHCRLLDEHNHRRGRGTFDECQAKLDEIKCDQSLEPMRGRAVVLLHGLGRTRGSMRSLAKYLKQKGDVTVLRFGYPSTRAGIDKHAQALASVIAHLDGIDEIDLVAHSLGNLVIRRYLAQAAESAAGHADPRIHRIVMLTPPNQGSRRGSLWDESKWFGGLYRTVLGDSGKQVASDWEATAPRLATPCCEFGIIAGGRGDDRGWHDRLPGDDDGTVAVSETLLAGARDFRVVPVRHTFIADDPRVQEYVERFLEHGFFVSDSERRPIAEEGGATKGK
jgi:pimeloyl-ACP methyl ester carboxylesterase